MSIYPAYSPSIARIPRSAWYFRYRRWCTVPFLQSNSIALASCSTVAEPHYVSRLCSPQVAGSKPISHLDIRQQISRIRRIIFNLLT